MEVFIKQFYDNNKKFYFLTSDGILDPLGESQITPYLYGLSKKYNLKIFSFEKQHNIKNAKFINNVKEKLAKHNIKWKYYKYHNNKILKLIEYIKAIIYINTLIILDKKIIFHLRSYPIGILLFPLIIFLKLNIIFDMRGFWIHERIDRNNLKKETLYYFFLLYLEKLLLNKSQTIITLTHEAKFLIKDKFQKQIQNKNLVVLKTYAETKKFKFIKKINYNKKNITFCYLGSESNAYNLEKTLLILKEISKILNNAKFKFIINKSNFTFIDQITKLNINKSNYSLHHIKHYEVPNLLEECDVGIFYANTNQSIKASFPTKISEYFSSGMPIMCNNFNSDVSKIILENNLGIISKFEKKFIKKDLDKLLQLLSNENRKKIKYFADNNLDISIGISKYDSVYSSFL